MFEGCFGGVASMTKKPRLEPRREIVPRFYAADGCTFIGELREVYKSNYLEGKGKGCEWDFPDSEEIWGESIQVVRSGRVFECWGFKSTDLGTERR